MQPTQLDPQVVNLAKAIRQTESGSNFTTKGASGEYGAYQFTDDTWNKQASKYGISVPLEKATPEQQNAVAYNQIKDWKDAGNNVAQIASMWNAGEGEPNAYTGSFSNGQPSVGVNKFGVKYSVPDYAYSVANAYQTLKNGGDVQADPNNPSSIAAPQSNIQDNSQPQDKSFLRKVGDFFTSSTQAAAHTIGSALEAPRNAQLYADALKQSSDITNNLQLAIKQEVSRGQDPSRLQMALKQHLQSMPKIEDFTGDVVNTTPEQVVGQIAGAGLEALSGGILEGGVKSVASKELGVLGKLGEGAKLGAAYGGVSGGINSLQNNESAGGVIGGAALGAVEGGATGAILSGAGQVAEKGLSIASKTGLIDSILPQTEDRINKVQSQVEQARQDVAKAYKDTLPLTPTEQLKEAMLLKKTGDNAYTTLAKYNINVGSKEAPEQLQKVADLFENSINHAADNEDLFNVNQIRNNAYNSINDQLTSATERTAAKNRVDKEINAIVKENGSSVFKSGDGKPLVDSSIVERLRKTGNDWAQYNQLNPDSVKNATGNALANAVRDQVEKEGTFPSYREANREWGKIIHAQQVLKKIDDSGKTFKVIGGLGGSIARKIISGALGLHTGGVAGLILSEMGSEYSAEILSNPKLRTYFDRKLIERASNGKVTSEVVGDLEQEVKSYIDKQSNLKRLPAPNAIYVPPTQNGIPYTPNPSIK